MNINEIRDLPHSKYVDIIENKQKSEVTIVINRPIDNMQTDMANFEALAIMCKCIRPNINVIIKFNEFEEWHKEFGNLSSKSSIYLRFLFRVVTFKEAFCDWVEISKDNFKEIEYFNNILQEAFKSKKVSNNIPMRKSNYNSEKGEEHQLENKFTKTSKGLNYLKKIYKESFNDDLLFAFNQLPNGLFNIFSNEKASENNRIFTTGFYDIWGIDKKGNLCIFELKKDKGNSHLGIISELLFYAIYAKKVLCDKNCIHEKKKNLNYRGYELLYDNVINNKITGINAIFLLGQDIYSGIKEREKDILKLLDTNNFGIKFGITNYDIDILNNISENEIKSI